MQCGLSNPKVTLGKLTYGQDATPFDLIQEGGQAAGLAAYEDLEASARSCVATLFYQGDTLTGAALTEPGQQDIAGWTEDYSKQSCFNRLYRAQFAKAQILTPSGVATFAKEFRKTCG